MNTITLFGKLKKHELDWGRLKKRRWGEERNCFRLKQYETKQCK